MAQSGRGLLRLADPQENTYLEGPGAELRKSENMLRASGRSRRERCPLERCLLAQVREGPRCGRRRGQMVNLRRRKRLLAPSLVHPHLPVARGVTKASLKRHSACFWNCVTFSRLRQPSLTKLKNLSNLAGFF